MACQDTSTLMLFHLETAFVEYKSVHICIFGNQHKKWVCGGAKETKKITQLPLYAETLDHAFKIVSHNA